MKLITGFDNDSKIIIKVSNHFEHYNIYYYQMNLVLKFLRYSTDLCVLVKVLSV